MASNTNPTNSHPESTVNSSGGPLPADLMDLINAVRQLPATDRAPLEGPLSRVVDYTRRRRRILDLIQEALGQLRLDMKYLMLDLEATRRERDTYKQSLDGNQ